MYYQVKISIIVFFLLVKSYFSFSQNELMRQWTLPDYKQSDVLFLSKSDSIPYVVQLLNKARYYISEGEYEKALAYCRFAKPFAIGRGDEMAHIYANMAVCYDLMNRPKESISYYQTAIECIPFDNDRNRKISVLRVHIAKVYLSLRDYDRALSYIDSAIPHLPVASDPQYVLAFLLRAQLLMYTNATKEDVVTAYRKVIRMVDTMSNVHKTIMQYKYTALANLSAKYNDSEIPDSAIYYLSMIKENEMLLVGEYIRTGLRLIQAEALVKKGEYKEAKKHLEQILGVVTKMGYDYKRDLYSLLSKVYSESGNYKSAFEHQKNYINITDSLYRKNEQNIIAVNKIESEYLEAKKNLEISHQQLLLSRQENKLQRRNYTQLILGILSGCLLLMFFLYRRNARHKQELLKEQLDNVEKANRIAQIQATLTGEEKERGRIAKELHDAVVSEILSLKLNMETIRNEIPVLDKSGNYRKLLYQSQEIADKVRETAHNMMPVNLRKNGLYASIEAFINRINSKQIHFTFQGYGTLPLLNPEVEKIIFTSVLELIQNILKHSKATEAIIQLNYYAETLLITVEDNGTGITTATGEGMGLENLRANMEMLHAYLDIQSSEYTGTTILIEIPVESLKEKSIIDN